MYCLFLLILNNTVRKFSKISRQCCSRTLTNLMEFAGFFPWTSKHWLQDFYRFQGIVVIKLFIDSNSALTTFLSWNGIWLILTILSIEPVCIFGSRHGHFLHILTQLYSWLLVHLHQLQHKSLSLSLWTSLWQDYHHILRQFNAKWICHLSCAS